MKISDKRAAVLVAYHAAVASPAAVDWQELAAALAAVIPAVTVKADASGIPAWFSAVSKARHPIKHSLVVTFADGQRFNANAWQDPGKPVAVGRALRVAIEFYRQRHEGRFRDAVPEFSAVALVDGDEFGPAECSALTADLRAAIPAPEGRSKANKIASARAYLARMDAIWAVQREADLVSAEAEELARQWAAAEGEDRQMIEAGIAAYMRRPLDGHASYAAVAQELGKLEHGSYAAAFEADMAAVEAPAFDPEDDVLDAIEAEPLEAAYPDDEPEVPAAPAEPTFSVIATGSHRAGDKLLGLAGAHGGDLYCNRWKDTRAHFPLSKLDVILPLTKGMRIVGLPRKPRRDLAPMRRREAVEARIAALRASRPLPFPDRGRKYRPGWVKPRISVRAVLGDRRPEPMPSNVVPMVAPRLAAALARSTTLVSPIAARAFG